MAKGIYVGAENSIFPVEYIESSGTQYIDTGFKPNQNTRIIADIQYTSVPSGVTATFGCRNSNADQLWVHFRPDTNNFALRFGNSTSNNMVSAICTDRNIVDLNKNVLTVGSKSVTATNANVQSPCNAFIFAISDNGKPQYNASARLYSCKIYDNDKLVRDFIPCKNQNGVVGLYDIVNGLFYGNSGTGSFISRNALPVQSDSVARKIKTPYVGVNRITRKVKKGYIGVNGIARKCYEGLAKLPLGQSKLEEIVDMVNASYDGEIELTDYWKIGDEFTMTLTTGEAVTMQLADFKHDDLTSGGKAQVTFVAKKVINKTREMYSSRTNMYGWDGSTMRTYLNADFYNTIPSVLKEAIKAVNKKTTEGRQSTTLKTTSDKIWLLSGVEAAGKENLPGGLPFDNRYSVNEGTQYPLLIGALSRQGRVPSYNDDWWLRSPYMNDTYKYCTIDNNGQCNASYADGSYNYIVPCFCL